MSKKPDKIYINTISTLDGNKCGYGHWVETWHKGCFSDEPYYSQSKVDELLENAHMAGQADAGVDPSYSNAQMYVIKLRNARIEK